jgi:porphobilinogen deaminase
MPVPTEQLAADIRESDRRLTDAIVDVGRKVDANHAEFSAFRGEVNTRMETLRGEMNTGLENLRGEIKALRGEMNTGLENLRGETNTGLENLRGEIKGLRGEINTGLEKLTTRFDLSLSVARWAVGIAVPLLISVLAATFTMIWNASRLDALVRQHEEALQKKSAHGEIPKPLGAASPSQIVAGDVRPSGT